MFCTACATFNLPTASTCAGCGLGLDTAAPPRRRWQSPIHRVTHRGDGGGDAGSGTKRAPVRQARSRSRLIRLLYVVPLLLLIATSVGGGNRYRAEQADRAAWYARGESALLAGRYPEAIDAFAAAGPYRDAPTRRASVMADLAPYRTAYFDGLAALDAGHYDDAIAALVPVVRDLPTYEDAATLLANARHYRAGALDREAAAAAARRDWLAAERALAELVADDPDNPEIAARLATVRRTHAPLVFTRDHALYLIGPDANDERRLTDDVPASWPVWSPDRSRIAFVSYDKTAFAGITKLYVIDADGTNLTELDQWVSPHVWPAWSPDGTRIAYIRLADFDSDRSHERGLISIHVVDVASGERTDLTGDTLRYATSPSWSPTGDRIAFVSQDTHLTPADGILREQSEVYIAMLASGDLLDVSEGRLQAAVAVNWSPVADQLLVYSKEQGTWYEPHRTSIHLLDLATGELNDINPDTQAVSRPVWAPDGSGFAYVDGDTTVRIWTPDQPEEWVPMAYAVAGYLTWSPDGTALLAAAADPRQASLLIPLDDGPGPQVTIQLDYDVDESYGGPPQWSSSWPLPTLGPPTVAGTALDNEGDG